MFYARKLVTAPTIEPLTTAQIKARQRIDSALEDAEILDFTRAAREHVEAICSRALLTQTWDVFLDRWPCGDTIRLPLGSLQSVSAFEWTHSDGTTTSSWTVDGAALKSGSTIKAHIDTTSEPGRIVLAYNQTWPSDVLQTVKPIRVRIVAGWTAADAVPAPIKAAISLLAGHLYRNREAVVLSDRQGIESIEMPLGFHRLLDNWRLQVSGLA